MMYVIYSIDSLLGREEKSKIEYHSSELEENTYKEPTIDYYNPTDLTDYDKKILERRGA